MTTELEQILADSKADRERMRQEFKADLARMEKNILEDLARTEKNIIEDLARAERNIIAAIERWGDNRVREQRNANRWMVGTIIAAIGVAVALTAAVEKLIS